MPTKQRFSPKARSAARLRALQALYQWQLSGQDIDLILQQFLDEEDMNKVDIPYFKRLLHGIHQEVRQLDITFSKFLDRGLNQIDPIELAILRIGCYELKQCPDIPFKVVINEGVELAKQFGAEMSHKYINGILDKIAHT
jgi:N utilization substance protein B